MQIGQEGSLVLRCLEYTDVETMLCWLQDERVLKDYEGRDQHFDRAQVEEKFFSRTAQEEGMTACVFEEGGRPVGYLQFYPADAREYGLEDADGTYAADIFIGEIDRQGKGIGVRILRLVAAYLERETAACRLAVDPRSENGRAIRCYEKAGFRRVKVLPAHEKHEGKWHDCVLMEKRLRL